MSGTPDTMATLTGLTHDIFVNGVLNNVRLMSPTAQLFKEAGSGDFHLEGQNMVFAVDLNFKTGAMATDGKIPNFIPLDAVQGKISPIRRYAPLMIDNMIELQASKDGAFEDYGERIQRQLWDSWEAMERRQSVGASNGLLCKCSSRTNSTTFVVKDGYGHAGTVANSNFTVGSRIAWYDVSGTAIAGAGVVTAVVKSGATATVTVTTSGTWEPSATLAADDLIYISSSSTITDTNFITERNLAPNGLGTIIDPDAAFTTVFNISETTYPRWKPYRQTFGTVDHTAFMTHWLQLESHRGFPVSPSTDVVLTYPAIVDQVSRAGLGFQQQAYTGGDLKLGWTGVTIRGVPLVGDPFFYHDGAATVNKESLFRIQLGGDPDFFDEDGSMWDRMFEFDGKTAYVRHYMQYMSNHRGAHGYLGGAVVDGTSSDYSSAY